MIRPTEVATRLGPVIRRIERLPARERMSATTELLVQIGEVQAAAATCRRLAISELRETMTLEQIAECLGRSVTRIKQLQGGGVAAS